MQAATIATIRDCAEASAAGRIGFPEVLRRLGEAGIERYHADLVRGETTYYTRDGDSEAVRLHAVTGAAPAAAFSAGGMAAAVRGAQSGALAYPAFCVAARAAGCVGYLVSLAGRRVVYYGRSGDCHVEWFPAAR